MTDRRAETNFPGSAFRDLRDAVPTPTEGATMPTTTLQSIAWITKHMPAESDAAMRRFVERNPMFGGAGWDDCLDIILDADADLQWTEPLHEVDETFPSSPLESAVTTTLVWAVEGFCDRPAAEQIIIVRATIANNSGAS